jgi:hypothetical protein
MAGFSKTQLLLALQCVSVQALSDVFGTEVSAVVFGQHVHWMLILVIFSSGVV